MSITITRRRFLQTATDEGGSLSIPSDHEAVAYDREGVEIKRFKGARSHVENFIKAVRSRQRDDLSADIEQGHLSSALCHTANVSYRLGRPDSPDRIRRELESNPDASPHLVESFDRFTAHLASNGVDLAGTQARLGPWLNFDPIQERFIDNQDANRMLRREYRSPFVVPDEV